MLNYELVCIFNFNLDVIITSLRLDRHVLKNNKDGTSIEKNTKYFNNWSCEIFCCDLSSDGSNCRIAFNPCYTNT